jgi:hypothetical protein
MCKKDLRTIPVIKYYKNSTQACVVSYSEVVITLDFESSILGSNPGKRRLLFHYSFTTIQVPNAFNRIDPEMHLWHILAGP